jgi:hypothetical protein
MEKSGKFFCVGDVHGHLGKLKSLWAHMLAFLKDDFENHTIVFLGDYVDRGPDVRGTIDFLIELKKTHSNLVFLLGNHEYALMSFLGLLPEGRASYAHTWADPLVFCNPNEVSMLYDGPDHETMHLQGRRYNFYDSMSTFRSYGVEYLHREALLEAMPQAHKDFFTSLAFIHEVPGFIFVHAGFEGEDSYSGLSLEEQLSDLRMKVCRHRLEPLSGRERVIYNVPELVAKKICVVSGHHNKVHFSPYRVIMDASGGRKHSVLAGIQLPSCVMLDHTGEINNVNCDEVFPP